MCPLGFSRNFPSAGGLYGGAHHRLRRPDGTRTHTPKDWNLNPARIPISPQTQTPPVFQTSMTCRGLLASRSADGIRTRSITRSERMWSTFVAYRAMVGPTGIEPVACRFSGDRSNQSELQPHVVLRPERPSDESEGCPPGEPSHGVRVPCWSRGTADRSSSCVVPCRTLYAVQT